jgi:RimJ/RimL family protein N-acetyltransferase
VSSRHERKVVLRSLTDEDRAAIAGWHYPAELAVYDPGRGALDYRGPDYVALTFLDGALMGYGTFGPEARVPGGVYTDDPEVLDVGLGLRPDLVGCGLGGHGLSALLADARARLPIRRVRATVASANLRATALVQRLGFTATHRFRRPSDGREFIQYERDVGQGRDG